VMMVKCNDTGGLDDLLPDDATESASPGSQSSGEALS